MEDLRHKQIKNVQSFTLKGNSVTQHLISALAVPAHFFVNQFCKRLAGHLPALTLIRLGNAPAQSILVIFITATHNNALQITVEHDMYINYIFQPCDAGCVECDAVPTDHNSRVPEVCKQFFSHDLIPVIRKCTL